MRVAVFAAAALASLACASSAGHAVAPKGIRNTGNFCYLAAMLQTLFWVPELRTHVLSPPGSGQPSAVHLALAQLFMDMQAAGGRPVILAVGLPDVARPQTHHKPTQRRVDLLAIEQNAWVLAARDPRCVVMATRTEIDWAVKRGQVLVWAPSKMVLDATDGPTSREPTLRI